MELEEKKKNMIDTLKKVYKDQYDAIQPIPYVKDKLYCVDKIFVEGGADVTFFEGNPPTDLKQLNWTKLDSYKEIFRNANTVSHRCIIDGEPGYGKSTLTLQLAYDWSNGISDSPLCDVEILILLRLRQLKNLGSIYKAIKYILLPTEPRLRVKDIQQVIEKCSSVVLAFDGYDEFPHQAQQENDINKIITSEIFQSIDVTLTTRILPPQLTRANDSDGPTTKLVKLRGFDERAREEYISKAVVGNDATAVERIKRQLKENHAINALCQVPLLFVVFAHMFFVVDVIPTICNVTGAVRHMISCFHKHMRDKMEDSNVKAVPDFENEHSELDKIAFEGLTNKNQQLIWKRDDLRQRLGEEFYDMYIRIGLLVEETVFNESSFTIEVHFYHKIFCEWFAAHHFVRFASRPDVKYASKYNQMNASPGMPTSMSPQDSRLLLSLNPFDLKYFFRFACGLNQEAGNKVIHHLHKRQMDDELFSCIAERLENIDGIREVVEDICSKSQLVFDCSDMMLMRDTVHVLNLGCQNQYPIKNLLVKLGSYQKDSDGILFPSGLRLPFLNTVKQLEVDFGDFGEQISEEEVIATLKTAIHFEQLNRITFCYSILPEKMPKVASVLHARDMKVMWKIQADVGIEILYQFKLTLGEWELQNLNDIRSRCSGTSTLHISRSELTHEWFTFSTKRVFEEVRKHKVPIRRLTFEDKPHNDKETVSVFANRDFLPPSIFYSVKEVTFITEDGRIISHEEFVRMINYVQEIPHLTEICVQRMASSQPYPAKSHPRFVGSMKKEHKFTNFRC